MSRPEGPPGFIERNGGSALARFFRANTGLMAALTFAALVAGAALWFAGIIALPKLFSEHVVQAQDAHERIEERVDENRVLINTATDSLASLTERLTWAICIAIPPPTRREKALLNINCDEVEEDARQGRGLP